MRFHDLLTLSLKNFKNRKSRVLLTVLGVAVAIGVIMFLISLGYGLQRTILERITTEDSILTLDVYPPNTEAITLDEKAVSDLQTISDIKVISPQAVVAGQVTAQDISSETSINIIDESYFKLSGFKVSGGEAFAAEKKNTVIISPTVAELFGMPATELLGKQVQLTLYIPQAATENAPASLEVLPITTDFTVIGVIDQLEGSNQLFIRYSDISDIKFKHFQFIKIQVTSRDKIEPVRLQVIEKGYLVSALSDVVEQANQVFTGIQVVLAVFGIFSLLVAAIGLINTMTISLLERINEIGIMRAIGASAWDIKKIFLIESTLIGFFGGVVGIVIGYISGFMFSVGLNVLANTLGGQAIDIFYTPGWFIIFVIGFSAGVGFISGVLPARKAGNLNALEALRYK